MSSNTFSYCYFMVVLFGKGWGGGSFPFLLFLICSCYLYFNGLCLQAFSFPFCNLFLPLLACVIRSVHLNFDLLT